MACPVAMVRTYILGTAVYTLFPSQGIEHSSLRIKSHAYHLACIVVYACMLQCVFRPILYMQMIACYLHVHGTVYIRHAEFMA